MIFDSDLMDTGPHGFRGQHRPLGIHIRQHRHELLPAVAGKQFATAAQIAAVRAKLGLDRPILEQFAVWLGGMLQGDFGTSIVMQRPAGPLIAEALGRSPGFLPPVLYGGVSAGRAAPGFRDITSGSNGAYTARPGWDACTGLGVPDGEALLARLRA